MTVRDALALSQDSIPLRDAELLLCHVLERERSWLWAHPEFDVDTTQRDNFMAMLARRARHEPLQYIVGVQEFYGLLIRVTPDVLIPRPETELLVEAALQWANQQAEKPRIVDVGTGSGAIALALAANLPGAEIIGADISKTALAVARDNAATLGMKGRVRFVESDLLSAIEGAESIDAVVSNPPYVATSDAPTMQREVVEYEPKLAVFAGEDGLDVYRRLIPQAADVLRKGGLLAMEFGLDQHDALAQLLENWKEVRFIRDYAGIIRIVLAIRC